MDIVGQCPAAVVSLVVPQSDDLQWTGSLPGCTIWWYAKCKRTMWKSRNPLLNISMRGERGVKIYKTMMKMIIIKYRTSGMSVHEWTQANFRNKSANNCDAINSWMSSFESVPLALPIQRSSQPPSTLTWTTPLIVMCHLNYHKDTLQNIFNCATIDKRRQSMVYLKWCISHFTTCLSLKFSLIVMDGRGWIEC